MTKHISNKIPEFIARHKLAVIATLSPDNKPEAAIVGIALTDNLEIVFDTIKTTRKYSNLLQNKHIAIVIGCEEEITIQYEGEAHELTNKAELKKYKDIYFKTFPDGPKREYWSGITYIVVKPIWIRYSDFNTTKPEIFEFSFK